MQKLQVDQNQELQKLQGESQQAMLKLQADYKRGLKRMQAEAGQLAKRLQSQNQQIFFRREAVTLDLQSRNPWIRKSPNYTFHAPSSSFPPFTTFKSLKTISTWLCLFVIVGEL